MIQRENTHIRNYIVYHKKLPLREDTKAKLSYIIAKKKISLLKIKEDYNIDILYLTHLGNVCLTKSTRALF